MTEWSASRRRTWFGVFLAGAFALALLAGLAPLDASNAAASPHRRAATAASASTVAPHHRAARRVAPTTEVTVASLAATSSTVVAPAPATSSAAHSVAKTQVKAAPTTVKPRPAVVAPPPAPTIPPSAAAFLACVRQRESHGNYGAVSPGGTYMGAYQFSQSAWDSAAHHAGRADLVGQKPNLVAPAEQDAMALVLYQWLGAAPWGGACS